MSIYLRAAKRIQSGDNNFACFAIMNAVSNGQKADLARREFIALFAPKKGMLYGYGPWWNYDNKDARIIALLLMHWISKDHK